MPYYKNSSKETLIVPDINGIPTHVVPNGTIATYRELSEVMIFNKFTNFY